MVNGQRSMVNGQYTVHLGDCLVALRMMADDSIDAIVTDPPYGLAFMGKRWDYDVPGVDVWVQCFRVLKPGGHLLAFGGTRTYHRMVVNIEDAGFEIRDQLQWLYGSGFPKSLDVSKAIDKAAGAEREVVGDNLDRPGYHLNGHVDTGRFGHGIGGSTPETRLAAALITAPATPDAERWQGWGTALKPANEPICMARKPVQGTVAANVLAWGTGAINVDGCRVGVEDADYARNCSGDRGHGDNRTRASDFAMTAGSASAVGRWPANVVHDGSDEVVGLFPQSKSTGGMVEPDGNKVLGERSPHPMFHYGDTGSAARFFYCAKASKAERDAGLEGLALRTNDFHRASSGLNQDRPGREGRTPNTEDARNHHPTVKPVALMRWLVRLVTPPGGVVLDPFCGSGSTGVACMAEGFRFVGVEREAEYVEIARRRIGEAVADQAFGLFAEAAD